MLPIFPLAPFIHLTAALVVAFFVLFAASRAEGRLRAIGNWLGAWIVILGLAGTVFGAIDMVFHKPPMPPPPGLLCAPPHAPRTAI